MSWDIFSKSKIQYFLEKLKGKFVQKETGKGLSSNDYTTTDKNKVALIDSTTTSATGNPISIADLKSAQIALNPVITFEPIQAGSGTPSPSNIRAISGYDKIEVLSCGKNLFDISKVLIGTVSGNAWTITVNSSILGLKVYDLKFKENTSYTFSGTEQQNAANKNCRLRVVYTDGTTADVFSDTATTAKAFRFVSNASKTISYITATYGSADNVTITNLQIEEGNIESPVYAPYHKTTDLSESLGQTVYGGTLDVRTGKLISNRIFVNLKGHTASVYGNDGIYISNVLNRTGQRIKGICSHAFVRTTEPTWESGQMQLGAGNATIYWLNILTILGKTIQEFNTWLATEDVWVCYDAGVGNYTEIQLTPHEIALSQGYNYISTNGTSISMAYHNGELATHADVEQLSETVGNQYNHLESIIGGLVAWTNESAQILANETKTFDMTDYSFGILTLRDSSGGNGAVLFSRRAINTNIDIITLSSLPNASISASGTTVTLTKSSGYNGEWRLLRTP